MLAPIKVKRIGQTSRRCIANGRFFERWSTMPNSVLAGPICQSPPSTQTLPKVPLVTKSLVAFSTSGGQPNRRYGTSPDSPQSWQTALS